METYLKPSQQFPTIQETAKALGLSTHFLRTGCREGRIPHVRVGCVYRIDLSALLEQLHSEARKNAEARGVN